VARIDERFRKVAADEASTTCDEDVHTLPYRRNTIDVGILAAVSRPDASRRRIRRHVTKLLFLF
jgi:hypothetical protein